ncbi:helix-turn-helix transcriptional regulator [Cupriavidus sp. IDO]|nr:helix-turn-helix transcriptional regulator [Cupriavidus sp. IDO]
MPTAPLPSTSDRQPDDAIFALWDELADFAVGDGEAAVGHLLSRLCAIFGAQNALWSVVVRLPSPDSGDPLNGWRPRIVKLLKPLAQVAESVQEQFDALWSQSLDISQILAMAGDEAFRTRLLFEALPAEWFDGPHYRRHYLAVGHADSMSMRCALNEDVRVHIFIFRSAEAPRFASTDKEPFGLALRGLRWLYRQQVLSHGLLIAKAPLTATERKVLLELLDGRTEKVIAALLGQSPNTTHIHVKSIYAKFGVHNRAELTSLWLGRLP